MRNVIGTVVALALIACAGCESDVVEGVEYDYVRGGLRDPEAVTTARRAGKVASMKAVAFDVFAWRITEHTEGEDQHGAKVKVQGYVEFESEAEEEAARRSSLDETHAEIEIEIAGHSTPEEARAALVAMMSFVDPVIRLAVDDLLAVGGGYRHVKVEQRTETVVVNPGELPS